MKNKKGRFLIGLGLLLITAAALLAAYNIYDDWRAKDASQQSVEFLEEIIASGGTNRPVEASPAKAVSFGNQTLYPAMNDSPGEASSASAGHAVDPQTQALSSAPTPFVEEASAEPTDLSNRYSAEATASRPAAVPTAAPSSQAVLPPAIDDEIITMLQEGEVPDYILNPEMEMPVISHEGQDYIGVLEIPALELKIPVISQWNYARLRIAPCRYAGSAYTNDLVISAHNYQSHFGLLKKLDGGERVIFTDVDGNRFDYIVEMQETLAPRDVEGMTDAGWDLTLFTCTLGGSYRLAVRCTLRPKMPVQ